MSVVLVEIRDVLGEAMRQSPPGHPHVGSEHLALVAWEGPDGLAAIARDAGVDALRLASTIRNCCTDTLDRPMTSEPPITARTAAAAAMASQIAMADGLAEIGSGHLLLALLEEPGAIAWRGVRLGGLTLTGVYDGVMARRTSPPPAPGPRAMSALMSELRWPLETWRHLTRLSLDGPDEVEAVRLQARGARSYLADLATLGGRRGLLRAGEVVALTGPDADVAVAAAGLAFERAA